MEILLLLISVFLIALIFSMFGMGGGLFYMPLFLFFIDNFREASLLSFLCIFVTAFSAMNVYHRKKLIDWRLVGYLGGPLIVMVFVTGFLLKVTPPMVLKIILGATLFLAGFLMIYPINSKVALRGLIQYCRNKFPDKQYCFSPIVLSPISLMVGLLSGMSGVAGGVFEIPIMVNLLRASTHTAVATSAAIVCLASLLGGLGRILSNHYEIPFNFYLILCMILCAFAGGQIGPRISVKLEKHIFKKICGVFVLLIGFYYIVQGMEVFG